MLNKFKQFYNKGNANRAVINTSLSYLQRFFAAVLSLITTPLILKYLGVEDFGIYTLTLGFVGTLTFLNWSLSSATQRFLAFALGENSLNELKTIYSTIWFIHIIYGVVMFLTLLIIGNFFVDNIFSIPNDKVAEAITLMNLVAFIALFNIITIPLIGLYRSYENFLVISFVKILEPLFKLILAILLIYDVGKKLIFYGYGMLIITLITFFLFYLISILKYKHLSFNIKLIKREIIKKLLGFLSWTTLGALAIMSRNHGVQVLINIFFGVVKNAAYGIAMQVNSAMSILSQGIISSLSPQIIKSAGAKDYNKMIFLMRTMSKFATFSVLLVAIPIYFQLPKLLKLWLGENVPDSTISYIRLIIILGQVVLLSAGIQTVFNAIGKIKTYNIWVSVLLIFNLPIAFVLFKFGWPSEAIIISSIFLEAVSLQMRLFLLKKHVDISIFLFYKDVFFKIILPTLIMSSIVYFISIQSFNLQYAEVLLSFIITLLIFPLIIYFFALEGEQKIILKRILKNIK